MFHDHGEPDGRHRLLPERPRSVLRRGEPAPSSRRQHDPLGPGGALLKTGRRPAGCEILRHSLYLRPNNPEGLFMFAGLEMDEPQVIRAVGRVLAIGGHDEFAERFARDYAAGTGASASDVLDRARREDVDIETPFVTGEGLGDLDQVLAALVRAGVPNVGSMGGPASKSSTKLSKEELERAEERHRQALRHHAEDNPLSSAAWGVIAIVVVVVAVLVFLALK